MAIQGPVGKENLDISFRLQSKCQLFDGSNNALLGARCNIVASASGIVFVGSINSELIVVTLKDVEGAHVPEQNVPVRKVPLPSPTTNIATNCDGSILAVSLKLNGTPHIQLYSVASFLTPNVQKIREFRVSSDNADAIQLCWNPVINATLAVCTETGSLNTYTLKEQSLEFHSIDPNLKAKCCCWSPKGKQIVAGFGNGKLMQFTPELKPAKAIDCPPGILPGPFDTIAVQWLSTFQFAVAFLGHQQGARPILHIVNAPKGVAPQYIAYNDVCYNHVESRPSKIYLQHVMQWNMLLVSSANSIDVCFLRITQPGDLPVWTQEFPNDLYIAELPLTPGRDESFPLGLELETGCSGRLLQEDGNPYPVMPMIHILSTYGVLCSFYVLNTSQTYIDICSPPRPLDPAAMSLFRVNQLVQAPAPDELKTPQKVEMPFSQPIGQSTPTLPKFQLTTTAKPPPSIFSGSLLGNTSQPAPTFSLSNAPSAFQSIVQTTAPATAPAVKLPQTQPQPVALITVPQTYTPSAMTQNKVEAAVKPVAVEKQNTAEDEQIYARMIQDEMKAFELELKTVLEKSRSLKVNIGSREESAEMRRSIEELDELKKEATETIDSLRSDVQSNRLGITEMFSMVYEARAKFDQSKSEKSIFMNHYNVQDRASKRTLDRLVKQVSHCEMQLQSAIQVMNSQWANYQEAISKSKKSRMHNPSLEGLYQTLTKQQEIIYRQNEKMALLKSKVGLRDSLMKQKEALNATIESFSDSIISISLADQVQSQNSKLTQKKLKNLRNLLTGREVVTITPQRPQRTGLNSEIIREKRLQMLKVLKRPKPDEVRTVVNTPNVSSVQQKALQQPTSQQMPFNQPLRSEEPPKVPFSGFGISPSQTSSFGSTPQSSTFGTTQKVSSFGATTQVQSFAPTPQAQSFAPTPQTHSFGSATQASSFGLNLSSGGNSKPSFGLSSAPLVLGVEKKRDESSAFGNSSGAVNPAPRLYLNPVAVKHSSDGNKTSSTIANANVAVSASFSIPLAHKNPTQAQSETSRVVEKKQDENKPPETTENTTFTFKLSEKKEESPAVTIKAPAGTPNFASLLSGGSENTKGFSFGTGTTSSPFEIGSKTNEVKTTKSSFAPTTTASIFSGFGSSPATVSTSGSVFGSTTSSFSGFGSGFSLNLGNDASKSTTPGFSLNLSSTSDSTKPNSAAGSFSFASSAPTVTSSTATEPLSAPVSTSSIAKPTTSAPFSFNTALSQQTVSSKPESAPISSTAPTLSFAGLGSTTLTPTTQSPIDLTKTSVGSTTSGQTVSSPSSQHSSDSALQGLTVCSPEVKPIAQSPPANIFGGSGAVGSAVKTETSSIFGGAAFGSALGQASTAAPLFGNSTTPAQATAIVASPPTSIFGTQSTSSSQGTPTTATPAPSLFGSLSLGDANKVSPSSPPTGLFSSLVKPDQSVFAATSPPTATSPFGGIFGGSGNQTSSVFGTQNTAASTTPSNIFSGATNQSASGNVFSSAQPATQGQQPSIFGQATNATGGSLFSQSTFASPQSTGGSIFGGSQPQGASPFGATNVFGATQSPQPASTGSIFGGQSSFGSQPSTGSVFGGSASLGAPSAFGSSSVFGGGASFSNAFSGVGQSGFGSTAAQGSTFTQQSPTFGGGATFGSPKSNIFGQQAAAGQQNSLFEQLGSQQSGNMFGSLAQNTQPAQPQPPQPGFQGSAFSSWR